MRKISTLLLLFIGLQNSAQSMSDGVYSTNFGTINLTFEVGNEYPNGGMVYGDYKNNGTITGSTFNNGKEIAGSFHNAAAEGKFIFFAPSGKQHFFDSGITSFNGNWGYGTDNKYSTNPDFIWKATNKTAGKEAIKNVTNVWSGKWNTTDGNLILQQVGNKVTGTYKGIGTVNATYTPQTRKLKGTFYNNNTKKTGHFEFNFEGNSFKGKWGWTSAMTDGVWNGTKNVKNNKTIVAAQSTTNTQTTGLTTTTNTATTKEVKYRISLVQATSGLYQSTRNPELYGFVSIQVYRVTNGNRQEIKSFGNKSPYFFNTTEDNAFPKPIHDFPSNSVAYYRDFIISTDDLNNSDVDIEIEITQHLKGKVIGSNYDYGKDKEILNLETIQLDQRENFKNNFIVGKNYANGQFIETRNYEKNSSVILNLKKL
jgi:hypothetical protein